MNICGLIITGYQIVFLILAALTLLFGLCAALVPNVLKSALFLGLTLFFVGGMFAMLNAPFLAVVQVMVYVGAVTTLIVLAILVSNRVMKVGLVDALTNPFLAGAGAGVLFLFLTVIVANSLWVKEATNVGPAGFTTDNIATALLQTHVFPFELVSVILLGALVAAVVLAKEDKEDTDD